MWWLRALFKWFANNYKDYRASFKNFTWIRYLLFSDRVVRPYRPVWHRSLILQPRPTVNGQLFPLFIFDFNSVLIINFVAKHRKRFLLFSCMLLLPLWESLAGWLGGVRAANKLLMTFTPRASFRYIIVIGSESGCRTTRAHRLSCYLFHLLFI